MAEVGGVETGADDAPDDKPAAAVGETVEIMGECFIDSAVLLCTCNCTTLHNCIVLTRKS